MSPRYSKTELKLMEEVFRLKDLTLAMQAALNLRIGNDKLAGYTLMGVAEDGSSGWHNSDTDHWLERDPNGVVFDPDSVHTVASDRKLHPFNEKWRGE